MNVLGGFTDEGKTYEIHTPFTPTTWANRLFNDEFQIEVSQRMEGKSFTVGANYKATAFLESDIKFFMNYNGITYRLCKNEGSKFKCVQKLYQSEVLETFADVDVSLRVFVPLQGQKMVWTVCLKNMGEHNANISFFSQFHFNNSEGYNATSAQKDENGNYIYYTGFPYYVKYDDYHKQKERITYKYVMSDLDISSYECNAQRFYGCDDYSRIPLAVKENKCSNGSCQQEECYSIMQHSVLIAPGETKKINFICGLEKHYENIEKNQAFFREIEEEVEKLKTLWDKRCEKFIIKTTDTSFDNLVNYWLKKQVVYFARLNRNDVYCAKRNQLQDLLGYSLIEPEDAFNRLIEILSTQHLNGYIKQYYTTDGSPLKELALMNHSDAYVWFIICGIEIIEHNRDKTLYDYLVGYEDSSMKESVYVHLKKAALYMLTQLGEHGLCLMHDGDWNDPVNGPGRLGKGESCWNSMALVYAINKLNDIVYDCSLAESAEKLKTNINKHCWDGKWYLAGINDEGIPYGSHSDEEAQKFLNTQTWSIFSGVCPPERIDSVTETIESMKNDYGYVLISPPFTKFNEIWGRVSLKTVGTTENGSVYNHSVMFKAFADVVRGDSDAAIETILLTLPTETERFPKNSQQYPLFYSNYYSGYKNENYGRSSYHYRTGTVAWLLWIVYQHIFGINISAKGIEISPNIPSRWKTALMTSVIDEDCYVISKDNEDIIVKKNDDDI